MQKMTELIVNNTHDDISYLHREPKVGSFRYDYRVKNGEKIKLLAHSSGANFSLILHNSKKGWIQTRFLKNPDESNFSLFTKSFSKPGSPYNKNEKIKELKLSNKRINYFRGEYKNAGILPIFYHNSTPNILLPYENILNGNIYEPVLNILGGNKEINDDCSIFTACRQAWEKSGKQVSFENFFKVISNGRVYYTYIPERKYVLFLVKMNIDRWNLIMDERYYIQIDKDNDPEFLRWFKLRDIISSQNLNDLKKSNWLCQAIDNIFKKEKILGFICTR